MNFLKKILKTSADTHKYLMKTYQFFNSKSLNSSFSKLLLNAKALYEN